MISHAPMVRLGILLSMHHEGHSPRQIAKSIWSRSIYSKFVRNGASFKNHIT